MNIIDRLLRHTTLDENITIAFDNLRASKLRSGLTILGVVIGVATVMTMASIVAGVREQIVKTIEVAGPTTFYVMKVFSQQPLNPDALPKWVRIRPDLSKDEAVAISRLPEVKYAAIWVQLQARMEFEGTRTQATGFFGADAGFTTIQGGALTAGRWFTAAEERTGAAVAVIDESKARKLFGRIDPLDRTIQLGGRPVRVIGLYQPPENIFAPQGTETGAIVPYLFADHGYRVDKTNQLFICVKPRSTRVTAAFSDSASEKFRIKAPLA